MLRRNHTYVSTGLDADREVVRRVSMLSFCVMSSIRSVCESGS